MYCRLQFTHKLTTTDMGTNTDGNSPLLLHAEFFSLLGQFGLLLCRKLSHYRLYNTLGSTEETKHIPQMTLVSPLGPSPGPRGETKMKKALERKKDL